jgi:hypothetical protein
LLRTTSECQNVSSNVQNICMCSTFAAMRRQHMAPVMASTLRIFIVGDVGAVDAVDGR